MLNIEKKLENGALFIALTGELDTLSSPDFEKELEPLLPEADSITIDFEKLEYISSAGLRVLLSAQKVMNKQGSMVIRNVKPDIMEIFDVTGFVDILTIEE